MKQLDTPETILIRYANIKACIEKQYSRILLDALNRLEKDHVILTEGERIPRELLYLG